VTRLYPDAKQLPRFFGPKSVVWFDPPDFDIVPSELAFERRLPPSTDLLLWCRPRAVF